MLGRKDYRPEELANARKGIKAQLAAYNKLRAAADASDDQAVVKAVDALEPVLFTNMVLVLDRYFVHRLRSSTGKDGNPLNEVELMTESLLNNDRKFRGNNVIKYVPDEAVLKLQPGDQIEVDAAEFDRLAKAFFSALQERFIS